MSIFTRPILTVNLNNLLDNYKTLQKLAPNSVAAAVLKDDAYGLGALKVAEVLYKQAKCRCFFVAYGYEGAEVRKVAPDADIYALQGMGEDEIELFRKARLSPVVSSLDHYKLWKKNRIEGVKPVIQIETGLNRLGFREDELKLLSEKERAEFSFVMSHLACADNQAHFMNESQHEKFLRLKKKYFPNTPASLSASDGVFLGEDFQLDMVRLGAAMYGINTTIYRPNIMKPVIGVKAAVLQIADLKQGEYVGYSATYQARSKRKIGIVSIGYGDGYFRSLSNIGKVFFKGMEAKVLGRVSMDNLICDVTELKGLKVGDYVDVLDGKYGVDEMANDAGTIGYEILSRMGKGKRFVRKYEQNGK